MVWQTVLVGLHSAQWGRRLERRETGLIHRTASLMTDNSVSLVNLHFNIHTLSESPVHIRLVGCNTKVQHTTVIKSRVLLP